MTSFVKWLKSFPSRASRLRPRPRLVWLLVLVGVTAFCLGAVVSPLVWPILLAIVVMTAVIDVSRLLALGLPTVTRSVPPQPQIGQTCDVAVEMRWSRPQPSWARASCDVGLPEGWRAQPDGTAAGTRLSEPFCSVSVRAVPMRRGFFQFLPLDALWSSPWGLWDRAYRPNLAATSVLVLPDLTSWRKRMQALQQTLLLEGRHIKRLGRGQTAFAYIDDYGWDDDPRHINWSATARKQRTMKNVYEPERDQQVILALDCSRYMAVRLPDEQLRMDVFVSCAAAVAEATQAAGDAVGLLAFHSQVMAALPPGKGAAHLHALVRELAVIEPERVQGGYQSLYQSLSGPFGKRSLLVILSELDGVMSDNTFLSALARFRQRHPTLFVTLKDVAAQAQLDVMPTDAGQLAALAAAQMVLQERADAISKLRSQGVEVIESAPGDAVVDVVRAYLARRRRFSL